MTDKNSKIKGETKGFYRFLIISISFFLFISHFSLLIATVNAQSGERTGILSPEATGRVPASPTDLKLTYPWSDAASPAELVARFYQIALGLVGGAALVVIIVAAIIRVVSAGNTSRIGTANEWIKGAIWGIVLLLGSYLILNTINPALVELRNPNLEEIKTAPITTPSVAAPLALPANRAARMALLTAGGRKIYVNKPECPTPDATNCTDLVHLPDKAFTGLITLYSRSFAFVRNNRSTLNPLNDLREDFGGFMLTGGAEAGHRTHGPGEPIVDINLPVDATGRPTNTGLAGGDGIELYSAIQGFISKDLASKKQTTIALDTTYQDNDGFFTIRRERNQSDPGQHFHIVFK